MSLDCGHWIQQEKPGEVNQAILVWLEQQDAASTRRRPLRTAANPYSAS